MERRKHLRARNLINWIHKEKARINERIKTDNDMDWDNFENVGLFKQLDKAEKFILKSYQQ